MRACEHRPFSLSLTRTIALVLHYFVGYLFIYRIISSQITLVIQPGATYILPSVQLVVYSLTMLVTICLAWPSIQHSYLRFKENIAKNISFIALMCVVGITLNITLSILISFITGMQGSNNQNVIIESTKVMPIMSFISGCFFAPVVEECVFRSGVYAFLRRKLNFMMAAIVSGVFFATIHFADVVFTGNVSDFSFLIVYTVIGIVLAYAYEKSDSMMVSAGVHFLNNVVSMVTMFL